MTEQTDQRIDVKWEFLEAERWNQASEALQSYGEEVPDPKLGARSQILAVPMLPIILGVFAVVKLARVILEMVNDAKPGLIIDARTQPVSITENPSVAGDKAVTIGPDGTMEVVDIADDESLDTLIDALLGKELA